jgi:hypothetical protein
MSLFVMAGLVPAIHVLLHRRKAWMPGIKPGMTWMGRRIFC